MMTDDNGPFRPLEGKRLRKPTSRRQATQWVSLVPVPDGSEPPLTTHYKHGQPSLVYEYRGADGELLGLVCRFDGSDGQKVFCPLTYCRNSDSGEHSWRWKWWDTPRPLFGLDRLSGHPGATVIVCEGEKAAEAAARLLPDYVAVTSPNGSKSAPKADWSPLAARDVIIWPDNDKPGEAYAAGCRPAARFIGNNSFERLSRGTTKGCYRRLGRGGCASQWMDYNRHVNVCVEGFASCRLSPTAGFLRFLQRGEPMPRIKRVMKRDPNRVDVARELKMNSST